jgi:hypothetical protein
MKYLEFSGINQLGAMFDVYSEIPFIIFVIEVGGKEFTGTVNTITIKDGGNTIVSGKFHPYLQLDFFEAFDIFPEEFTVKNIIDLKAGKDSSAAFLLFTSSNILTAGSKHTKQGVIETWAPYLVLIKNAINEFSLSHPEANSERAFF